MDNSPDSRRDLNDLSSFLVAGSAGECVFRHGAAATEMYFISKGTIELVVEGAGGARRVERLGRGDFFGEMSLLEMQPREVTAQAVTSYELVRIDLDSLGRIIDENCEIAIQMVRRLALRLHEHRTAASGPRAVFVEVTSKREFLLAGRTEFTIGRATSGVQPDIDLGVFDERRSVSRQHATVLAKDDGFYLRSGVQTSNKTLVNGRGLEDREEIKLGDRDAVKLGDVSLIFSLR